MAMKRGYIKTIRVVLILIAVLVISHFCYETIQTKKKVDELSQAINAAEKAHTEHLNDPDNPVYDRQFKTATETMRNNSNELDIYVNFKITIDIAISIGILLTYKMLVGFENKHRKTRTVRRRMRY